MKDRKKIGSLKRSHKPSSQGWLLRQLNDPYVKQARYFGYRCRSAFKLKEMQEKENFFKKGQRILDLGCAPGSWSQVAKEYTQGFVLGVDLLPCQGMTGIEFFQGDFCEPEIQAQITSKGPFDGVISDAAPSSTGHQATDLLRIGQLAEDIWEFTPGLLRPGGFFLIKAYHTQEVQSLTAQWKQRFQRVSYLKPNASRKESKEIYVYASGYRPKVVLQ
ncbi:MAG: hypothetical protein BGO07_00465 [Alphaproteobacteria bacterium 40-19]|nr:MAG: hypothetical protein BGO07_00465 [Alphaproteobacteria bacterium 40-19]